MMRRMKSYYNRIYNMRILVIVVFNLFTTAKKWLEISQNEVIRKNDSSITLK